MHTKIVCAMMASAGLFGLAGRPADAAETCRGYGPQSPRDIVSPYGSNQRNFTLAPPASEMNLCNIHIHKNAEHKGPGFDRSAGTGEHGGWQCIPASMPQVAEMQDPDDGHGAFHGVRVGDTIEAHWVYTSCDVKPGKGLTSCMSETCQNPQLRVEAQVFLVVNNPSGPDFTTFAYAGNMVNGLHQPRALPEANLPVTYAGSTTGPKYSDTVCSPFQVTWNVRSFCMKMDIGSLNRWVELDTMFGENHAHGVRQIVTDPDLLSEIAQD